MKTLIMFENESAHFFEVDGDLSRFNDIYINAEPPKGFRTKEKRQAYETVCDELTALIYGEADENGEPEGGGEFVLEEIEAPTKDWDIFVRCGLIP